MQAQKTFKLILHSKIFNIPSNFESLPDINQDIYSSLRNNQQYEVKSNVSEDVFQSFINYWIHREIPNIHIDNISEYYLLSQEFNIMNNLIQIFRKFTSDTVKFSTNSDLNTKNKLLIQKNKEKSDKLDEKTKKFRQIIQILFDNRKTNQQNSFSNAKKELFLQCERAEPKFVDLLTKKEFNENGLSFVLDDEQKSAILFRSLSTESDIIVPRSITHDSKEYIVIGIVESAFQSSKTVKTVTFSEDSELVFIEKMAFAYSSLERITFPRSVTHIDSKAFAFCKQLKSVTFSEPSNLKSIEKCAFTLSSLESLSIPSGVANFAEDWCASISKLNHITITDSKNHFISLYNGNFLIGKTDLKSDIYDALIFARRDIEVAAIPPFIKRIEAYAFSNCSQLKKVLFSTNSRLESIGSFAFANSSLESITIPQTVKDIGTFIFTGCPCLKDVELSDETRLDSFSSHSFSRSSIDNIPIPAHFTHIGQSAFSNCKAIKTVHIAENSELKFIDNSAFADSSLERITIPQHVTQIDENAFGGCANIESIDFTENSDLRLIGKHAFSHSSLRRIVIPSSVAVLREGWCADTPKLINISVLKTTKKGQYISAFNDEFIIGKSFSKSDVYDVLLIARRDIEVALIPSFIKKIGAHAFNKCTKLKKVQFESDSQLTTIERSVFFHSSLENIVIPSNVTKISELSFSCCKKLKRIEFQRNSQLRLIKRNAFSFSGLENFFVPSQVTEIGESAFSNCKYLQIIEVAENSKLGKINLNIFKSSSAIIMVPPRLWDTNA